MGSTDALSCKSFMPFYRRWSQMVPLRYRSTGLLITFYFQRWSPWEHFLMYEKKHVNAALLRYGGGFRNNLYASRWSCQLSQWRIQRKSTDYRAIRWREVPYPWWLMWWLNITTGEKQPSKRTRFWGVCVLMQHWKGLVMFNLYAIDLRHLDFFRFHVVVFGEVISWCLSHSGIIIIIFKFRKVFCSDCVRDQFRLRAFMFPCVDGEFH